MPGWSGEKISHMPTKKLPKFMHFIFYLKSKMVKCHTYNNRKREAWFLVCIIIVQNVSFLFFGHSITNLYLVVVGREPLAGALMSNRGKSEAENFWVCDYQPSFLLDGKSVSNAFALSFSATK